MRIPIRALGALAFAVLAAGVGPAAAGAVAKTEFYLGSISGRVSDPAGAPLAGVRVGIVEIGRTATTGDDGRFALTRVPSGTYTLSFTVIGYAPRVQRVTLSETDLLVTMTMKPSVIEVSGVQA